MIGCVFLRWPQYTLNSIPTKPMLKSNQLLWKYSTIWRKSLDSPCNSQATAALTFLDIYISFPLHLRIRSSISTNTCSSPLQTLPISAYRRTGSLGPVLTCEPRPFSCMVYDAASWNRRLRIYLAKYNIVICESTMRDEGLKVLFTCLVSIAQVLTFQRGL